MSTLSITLPDETMQFLESEARRQNAGSPAEYVGRLLKEAQHRSAADFLEEKLLAGLASGPGGKFDEQWVDRMKERVFASTANG